MMFLYPRCCNEYRFLLVARDWGVLKNRGNFFAALWVREDRKDYLERYLSNAALVFTNRIIHWIDDCMHKFGMSYVRRRASAFQNKFCLLRAKHYAEPCGINQTNVMNIDRTPVLIDDRNLNTRTGRSKDYFRQNVSKHNRGLFLGFLNLPIDKISSDDGRQNRTQSTKQALISVKPKLPTGRRKLRMRLRVRPEHESISNKIIIARSELWKMDREPKQEDWRDTNQHAHQIRQNSIVSHGSSCNRLLTFRKLLNGTEHLAFERASS